MSDNAKKSFGKNRKRKKGHYKAGAAKKGKQDAGKSSSFKQKNPRKYDFQAGMVGILATLNDRQHKQATSELLSILPDFLPEPSEEYVASQKQVSDNAGDDITALLAAENATSNMLHFCETRVPNIVFIRLFPERFKHLDILDVVCKVYQSVERSKTSCQISRYVNRLVPVIASCPAYIDRITKCLRETLSKDVTSMMQSGELKENYSSFSVCFKSTYNQSVKRQDIEDVIVCHMASLAPSIRLNRQARSRVLVIGIHIVKAVCCISIMRDYFRFAKYNLTEFQQQKQSSTAADHDSDDDDDGTVAEEAD